uniref:Uncharacterized protein n=1 Tax=Physcomitrium patens TaxID=3218 RepID=A9RPM3_PHYPA|nr:hypothetical protein PHYPA_001321 [Physcomitrium patens]
MKCSARHERPSPVFGRTLNVSFTHDLDGCCWTMAPDPCYAFSRFPAYMIRGTQSLRCTAFAYCLIDGSDVLTDEESSYKWNQPDQDLILMAIDGIKDLCRPSVRDAVEGCQWLE